MSFTFRIERPVNRSSAGRPANGSGATAGTLRSSRTLATAYNDDSSDEEAEAERRRNRVELLTDFDSSRVSTGDGPLVIPAKPDRDFRALHLTKKRKKEMYRPEAAAGVMRQGNTTDVKLEDMEGLEKMNAKPLVGGLKVVEVKREIGLVADGLSTGASTPLNGLSLSGDPSTAPSPAASAVKKDDPDAETEDQKALRELVSGHTATADPVIDSIPVKQRSASPASFSDYENETDVFKRDVASRPDEASMEDYARIPVGSFGAALLRGMGWKEGQTASNKRGRSGPVEAYVPEARPSLLGIGAKALDADIGGGKDPKGKAKRPERRYVPLVRKVTDKVASDRDLGGSSSEPRSRSRSPARSSSRRYDADREDRRSGDRERDRDREDGRRSRREAHERRRDGGSSRQRDSDRRSGQDSDRGPRTYDDRDKRRGQDRARDGGFSDARERERYDDTSREERKRDNGREDRRRRD